MVPKQLGCLVSIVALASACTHTNDVHTVVPHREDRVVVTTDGRRFDVHPASGGWVTSGGQLIKPEHVVSTESRNHTRGAWEGIGLGMLIGSHVGAVLGAIGDDCYSNSYRADPVCGGAIGGALVGLATGALLLGTIGGARGSKIVHQRSIPRFQATPTTGGMTAQLSWQL